MKKPTRAARSMHLPEVPPSVGEQLLAKYDAWPGAGYSFEELRNTLDSTYEDVRAVVFAELRAARLFQRFDERRRTMVLVRSGR